MGKTQAGNQLIAEDSWKSDERTHCELIKIILYQCFSEHVPLERLRPIHILKIQRNPVQHDHHVYADTVRVCAAPSIVKDYKVTVSVSSPSGARSEEAVVAVSSSKRLRLLEPS